MSKPETQDAAQTNGAAQANPFHIFGNLLSDAIARMSTYAATCAEFETQFVARAQGAVANWAQLTQDTLAYGAQLSQEARKLGLDSLRKLSRTGA
jgi:hypothetical protein